MTTSSASWACPALANADLGPRTTLKVGGRIEWLLEPRDPDELVAAWKAARSRGYTPRILGGGANLIVADGTHSGVVIATGRVARIFRPVPSGEMYAASPDEVGEAATDPSGDPFPAELPKPSSDPRLVAWAGAGLPGLVRAARDLGLSGLEGLVGVPGHLGGGIAMNAGGRWGDLWDVIESVRLLTPEGDLVERAREDHEPSYRNGNLGEDIAIGAVLRLEPSSRLVIQETMRQYLSEKSKAQPVTERSCGCIFKNPDPELSDGRSAGQLIEESGAKGFREGAAEVSHKHGNFIVNQGGASATDVLKLIARVRTHVRDTLHIELEQEARVWE